MRRTLHERDWTKFLVLDMPSLPGCEPGRPCRIKSPIKPMDRRATGVRIKSGHNGQGIGGESMSSWAEIRTSKPQPEAIAF